MQMILTYSLKLLQFVKEKDVTMLTKQGANGIVLGGKVL